MKVKDLITEDFDIINSVVTAYNSVRDSIGSREGALLALALFLSKIAMSAGGGLIAGVRIAQIEATLEAIRDGKNADENVKRIIKQITDYVNSTRDGLEIKKIQRLVKLLEPAFIADDHERVRHLLTAIQRSLTKKQ